MDGDFLFIHINELGEFRSPDTIPISQAYQLACLRKYGFSGRILGDYRDRPLAPAEVRKAILRDRPLALGFTVYEENINRVRAWARYAKELAPDLPVILGGPQIAAMPGAGLLQMPEADALCRGEGETVVLETARALSRGKELAAVPGICCRRGQGTAEIEPLPVSGELDEIPSPFLADIIDPAGKDRIILFSSRGCPAACTFCCTPQIGGRRLRFHSIERIVAELQYLRARGARDFWFADPSFAAVKERLVALLEEIIARVPGITFWCQIRCDHLDRDLAGLLKAAGAHTVAFGLESADGEVLRTINKRLVPEQVTAAVRLAREAGIGVELFTMFGLPGETLARACRTLDFVRDSGVAVEGNSISQQLHLFFGSRLSDDPAAHGIRPLALTRPAYLSVARDFATDAMSKEEIDRMALLWRLNRTDFTEDVAAGRNLLERAGFIAAHEKALAGRPEADLMLAAILLQLEEYDRAAPLLTRLAAEHGHRSPVKDFLAGPFTGFRLIRRATAAPGCRVIFDCRGMLGGRVVPVTESRYQEAVLGEGTLLPDFEQGLQGLRAGRATQFKVRFPPEYGHQELAGQELTFQVMLHLVMEPVSVVAAAELAKLPRNRYRFSDLEGLRRHNERLYYLVLRDTLFRDLHQEMTDFLALLKFRLQLGFREEALAMVAALAPESEAASYAGRFLLTANMAQEAIAILTPGVAAGRSAGVIDLIKAHIKAGNYREAERLAADPSLADDIQALDLRVALAAHRQMDVATYLARMDDLLRHQVEALLRLTAS
jgi:anaerobic magnesium-protoporphyrin IX monomethyl ester cyclase